jgi:hypothetical protein
MPDQPLLVPMEVDCLVANASVLGRDSFRWWPFNYNSLSWFRSPEPLATDRNTSGPAQGVYLHWTLPDALRHGRQNPQGGSDYPLVPNRWLIVRMYGGGPQRQTMAWVVESDCPPPAGAGTQQWCQYLASPVMLDLWKSSPDATRNTYQPTMRQGDLQVAQLGAQFPLSSWSERSPTTMFLTAMGPANPLFSIYTPHNSGVFSFYDPLTGIDQDTLSYFVCGWNSDSNQDILASWPADTQSTTPFADLLDALNWSVAGTSATQPTSSVYHGGAFSLAWSRNGAAPTPDPLQDVRDSGKLDVAIGNTTIDAFTAFIAKQIGDPTKAELLRAFQYDFLQQLNQPNGDALLQEKIHQAWFGSKDGGYDWTIVEDQSDGSTAVNLTEGESAWLLQLNQDQAALDAAVAKLYSLQWELHALWLKNGYLSNSDNTFPQAPAGVSPPGLTPFLNQLKAQLDPSRAGSVAARLVAQIGAVQALLPKVPQPIWTGTQNRQKAFQNGIQAFAQQKALDSQKTLKSRAAARYWQGVNPVLLVAGVDPPTSAVSATALPVRQSSDVVTGFSLADGSEIDASALGAVLPTVANLNAATAAAQPLLQEFFLLDSTNAAAIANAAGKQVSAVLAAIQGHASSAYIGILPAIALGPWQQPWSPMFLEWTATYSNIPFTGSAASWWSFDGTDYHYTPGSNAPVTTDRMVGGISLLSPHASFVFGARLQDFVKKFGADTEVGQIDSWIEQTFGWKFLSQELVGFNQSLALRDTRAFRRPGPSDLVGNLPVAALTGYGDVPAPSSLDLPAAFQGSVNDVPFIPNGPVQPFTSARGGQLYFTNISLYDKFGRVLFAVQANSESGLFDYRNFPVVADSALAPDVVIPTNVASVFQLPPRLLQHSRLNFDLLDGANDALVYGVDAGALPIAGWVLPNHLDHSLLLYAADGTALGEYALRAGPDGSRTGQWLPPPHSTLTLDGVRTAAPHVADLIGSAQLASQAGFDAFLASIDSTLWTTDPLGARVDQNLSILVGRPLALLRARLQFQLDGDPIHDTGFAATFQPPPPDFLTAPFSIRLGDQATREDGLIGYFTRTDYDQFNSVAAPDSGETQSYVQPIGPLGQIGGGNYLQLDFTAGHACLVTLLADPRAAVHATTGILPVKQLDIPQQFVDAALARMEISFRMGPLLTQIRPTPNEGGATPAFPQSVVYPLPTEQNGSWSWWESSASAGTWSGYDLVRASADAQFTSEPQTLREGQLQFVANLSKQS